MCVCNLDECFKFICVFVIYICVFNLIYEKITAVDIQLNNMYTKHLTQLLYDYDYFIKFITSFLETKAQSESYIRF